MRARSHHRPGYFRDLVALALGLFGLAWPLVTQRQLCAADVAPGARSDDEVQLLRDVLRSGDFNRFVELSLASLHSSSSAVDPALTRMQVEALLGVGENAAADATAVSALSVSEQWSGESAPTCDELLLKAWLTARWRQDRPLDDVWLERFCRQANRVNSPTLAAAAFWRESLQGLAPYRIASAPSVATLPLRVLNAADSEASSEAMGNRQGRGRAAVDWIAIEINRTHVPNVLIDTGSQHTLISSAAAAAAGVEFAAEPFAMTGFAPFSARPGLVRKLDLGGVVLRDVPVLVGDSPVLVQLDGQAALGIDLLSHLRVVFDYPARQLLVSAADRSNTSSPPSQAISGGANVVIPLWTFSYAALAQGQLANNRYARTLIDTGAGGGAYVSTAWADNAARGFSSASGRLVSRRRQAHRLLANWRVGELRVNDARVRGMFPAELDRLDAFDVLVGHDVLDGRRVTIDLTARRLTLSDVKSISPADAGR